MKAADAVLDGIAYGGAVRGHSLADERTADPSATLRFGRDDKWKSGHTPWHLLLGVDGKADAPLRWASAGMTNLRAALSEGIR
jgi:hypothetical protein